jgi:hypothetical protein
MLRGYRLALALILPSAFSSAQEIPCNVEIPVNVMLPDGSLVRRLSGEAFVGQNKYGAVGIRLLASDTGPRQILFVMETGKAVRPAARRIETAVISEICDKARPQDSFGLLTAVGPLREMKLGASVAEIRAAADQLGQSPRGKGQTDGVMDALLHGVGWFQPPQPGDAIVLVTMGIEGPHRAGYSKVKTALAAARIRLFAFQLGQFYAGFYSTGVSIAPNGRLMPTASISPNQENLFALSQETGGVAFYENTADALHQYKLTDERLKLMSGLAGQIYKAVVEYYPLQTGSSLGGLVLDLADPVRKQLPRATVMYPRHPPDCSPVTGARTDR